jgi:hypothetical protein
MYKNKVPQKVNPRPIKARFEDVINREVVRAIIPVDNKASLTIPVKPN